MSETQDPQDHSEDGGEDGGEGDAGTFRSSREVSEDSSDDCSRDFFDAKLESEEEGVVYAQLGNFSGLSGPGPGLTMRLPEGSVKGSVISSLSSHSEHSPTYDGNNEEKSRHRLQSLDDEEDAETPPSSQFLEDHAERERPASLSLAYKASLTPVFDTLFGEQPSERGRSFSTLSSNALGSSHGSSHGNAFFPHRVRVTTTLAAKYCVLKDRTRLAQTIKFHAGAVWAMLFSPSGEYLSSAGQDSSVVVWRVARGGGGGSEKGFGEPEEVPGRSGKSGYSGKVELKNFLDPEPFRVLEGHTGDIIDLAWSKSNFLLSASTDKTVSLWHVSRDERLQFFRHPDIVTAVEFHPAHDRYYISGCFDRKLRVWDIIPDGVVQEWTQTTDTITSICFSPDGTTVAGGLIHGRVYFYDLIDFDQLKYKTQMDCRNNGGKYKRGTKVTGMCYRPKRADGGQNPTSPSHHGVISYMRRRSANRALKKQIQLLVSTNDSRVRLCGLDDYSLTCKYKGLKNKSMQIKASFSADGGHVICGSESGQVHVWATEKKGSALGTLSNLLRMGRRSNRNSGCESFEATSGNDVAATVAIFAPVDSVYHYLDANKHVLGTPQVQRARKPSMGGVGGLRLEGVGATGGSIVEAQVDDFSTRVIVTADSEGVLKVFLRISLLQ